MRSRSPCFLREQPVCPLPLPASIHDISSLNNSLRKESSDRATSWRSNLFKCVTIECPYATQILPLSYGFAGAHRGLKDTSVACSNRKVLSEDLLLVFMLPRRIAIHNANCLHDIQNSTHVDFN